MTDIENDFPIDCLVRVISSNRSSDTFEGHDRIGKVTGHMHGPNYVLVTGHFTDLREQCFLPQFLERVEIHPIP